MMDSIGSKFNAKTGHVRQAEHALELILFAPWKDITAIVYLGFRVAIQPRSLRWGRDDSENTE